MASRHLYWEGLIGRKLLDSRAALLSRGRGGLVREKARLMPLSWDLIVHILSFSR